MVRYQRLVQHHGAPAGLDAIEVAVDVELEKYRGVVTGASCDRGCNALKPKLRQIEFVNKDIYNPHWVVFIDVVIKALWQQCDLAAVTTLDLSRHLLVSINALIAVSAFEGSRQWTES